VVKPFQPSRVLEAVQRVLIKGMAGAMGYTAVEQVAHALESLLAAQRAQHGDLASTSALAPLLQDAVDALARHADEVQHATPSTVAPSLLARLANASGLPASTTHAPSFATTASTHREPARDEVAVTPSTSATRNTAPERPTVRQARIDLRHLDALLDLAGELVIARDRFLRAADASGDRQVRRAAADTARLVSALQEEVLAARLVPVGQVMDRFPRLVRDLARELGKQVEFHISGRDLALDRSMLDAIVDPVVHLLRNAVDHGLESPAERVARGKAPTGKLTVTAARERDGVRLSVRDDGRGIDAAAVRARAIAEGRLPADAGPLDRDGLVRLLAQPGFTTAAQVSALSGRGVGVDVVATRARSMGGTLTLETVAGEGTVFHLHLPMTLAIIRALLVRVGDATFAVPAAPVREAMDFDVRHVRVVRDRECIRWHGDDLPLIRLQQHLGLEERPAADAQQLLLEIGGRRLVCVVDALVGQQDVVVKPYDAVQGATPLFSGATILGDGRPALIVDTGSLS
jgi:two-component system, chemotaxis family, sensor kinase CheA